MLYGDEKLREMARSILPSTRRKSARVEKRQINRARRRQVNMEMRRIHMDPEVWDESPDIRGETKTLEMWWTVRDRRRGDKLKHFEKWAIEVTKDLETPRERASKMRAMLPKGLIGWHAMGHLESYDEFKLCPHKWKQARRRPSGAMPKRMTREIRRELLYEIICDGMAHSYLIRYLDSTHKTVEWVKPGKVGFPKDQVLRWYGNTEFVGPRDARWPTGIGDIDAFLDDLEDACCNRMVETEPYLYRFTAQTHFYRNREQHTWINERWVDRQTRPGFHPEWKKALDTFLRTWVETHRCPWQTASALGVHELIKPW